MSQHLEAEAYLRVMNPQVRDVAKATHKLFADAGCRSYVKTIYIGYDFGGEMVAALYGHAASVEVALALPEDAEGSFLVDASHLTWRTLPLAAVITDESQLDELAGLVDEACRRVAGGSHDVVLDDERFIEARRAREERAQS